MSADTLAISEPLGVANAGSLAEAAARGVAAVRSGHRGVLAMIGRLLWSRVYHDVPEQGDGQCDVHYAET